MRVIAQRYPGIRIRIPMGYTGRLQEWLEDGEIDAALSYGVERTQHIQARPLLEEPLWVVGPLSAKLRKRHPVSLARKPMILPHGPAGIRTLIDHACALSNIHLTVVSKTNAMSVQKSLVLGGHGYTILPPIAFAEELADARLRLLLSLILA